WWRATRRVRRLPRASTGSSSTSTGAKFGAVCAARRSCPLPRSPRMVNLDSQSLTDLRERLQANQFHCDRSLFDAAYEVVFRMIERDVFVRFVQSTAYATMVARAVDRRGSRTTSSRYAAWSKPTWLRNTALGDVERSLAYDSVMAPALEN